MGKAMVRRDPFDVFAPFFHLNRRWGDALRGFYGDETENRMIVPAMDVAETEDELVLMAELPGLPKDELKITIEEGVLTISGEKKLVKEEKAKDYHLVERRYGKFHREVTLPSQVDASKAEASFEDGVLTIRIPRSEEAKPKQLEIK